jgi:hypothetical protein
LRSIIVIWYWPDIHQLSNIYYLWSLGGFRLFFIVSSKKIEDVLICWLDFNNLRFLFFGRIGIIAALKCLKNGLKFLWLWFWVNFGFGLFWFALFLEWFWFLFDDVRGKLGHNKKLWFSISLQILKPSVCLNLVKKLLSRDRRLWPKQVTWFFRWGFNQLC